MIGFRDEEEPVEGEEAVVTPKQDSVLREYTVEEIVDLDVKVLKAKISALEGNCIILARF